MMLTLVGREHEVLRERAKEVPDDEFNTPDLLTFCKSLGHAVEAFGGLGLAAPQVGVGKRIIAIQVEARGFNLVMVNPVLEKLDFERVTGPEGCLSLPGDDTRLVERARAVLLTWRDPDGAKNAGGFTGLLARVVQHELDHLDGVLIDRLT